MQLRWHSKREEHSTALVRHGSKRGTRREIAVLSLAQQPHGVWSQEQSCSLLLVLLLDLRFALLLDFLGLIGSRITVTE